MSLLTRREWLTGLAGSALAASGQTAAPRRPNVVLVMTDDMGYGDLSIHGNPHIATPELDGLAREGVRFTRFYVSPVCAPTRSSLLTGRYSLRTGTYGVTAGQEAMRSNEVTLAEALRGAGYRTALMGKWHLGEHYPYVPHGQGFDEFIGFRNGHWLNYFDAEFERNGQPYPTKGYVTDALTTEAIRFMESNRRQPFFVYLAFNVPHSPFQVPKKDYEKFQGKGHSPEVAAVYGMTANLDRNIGRLKQALDRLGVARNTILIFLSDNGPNTDRFNSGLRGRKASVYEGGNRAPFFVRWPERLPAGREVDTIAAHIDVYPTVLEACSVPPPAGPPVDGKSILPLMHAGQAAGWPDRMLFTTRQGRRTLEDPYPGVVRTQRFNLVNGTELYDMRADEAEKVNVAAKHPDVVKRLRSAYEAWYKEAAAQCGFARYRIPVGYDEENPAAVTAPIAKLKGGVKFFRRGTAHDWIHNWTSTSDSMHWDIDVSRAGSYKVSLVYLCPASEVGTVVSVAIGGVSVEAAVRTARPLELKPNLSVIKGEDAYPRANFATLHIGTAKLTAGPAELTVRAKSKPGSGSMHLKEVLLERVG